METLSTIQDALRDYWGFDSFLPLQKDAMECALGGRDSRAPDIAYPDPVTLPAS